MVVFNLDRPQCITIQDGVAIVEKLNCYLCKQSAYLAKLTFLALRPQPHTRRFDFRALKMKFVSVYECNFYFYFGRTIANFTLKVCYNLVHFRNLYKGVTLKPDILPTMQSMNLIFVCVYN